MTSFSQRWFGHPEAEQPPKPNRAQRRAQAKIDTRRTRQLTREHARRQRDLDE